MHCCYFEGQPRMIATSNMIALRSSLAALARLSACKLLQFPVKLLDLPTHLILLLNRVRRRLVWAVSVCDHPLNVAVCGNYLEQSYFEGQLLQLHHHAIPQLPLTPLELVKMYVATFAGQAHQPVTFESGHEHHAQAHHQLEIVHRTVPTV